MPQNNKVYGSYVEQYLNLLQINFKHKKCVKKHLEKIVIFLNTFLMK